MKYKYIYALSEHGVRKMKVRLQNKQSQITSIKIIVFWLNPSIRYTVDLATLLWIINTYNIYNHNIILDNTYNIYITYTYNNITLHLIILTHTGV